MRKCAPSCVDRVRKAKRDSGMPEIDDLEFSFQHCDSGRSFFWARQRALRPSEEHNDQLNAGRSCSRVKADVILCSRSRTSTPGRGGIFPSTRSTLTPSGGWQIRLGDKMAVKRLFRAPSDILDGFGDGATRNTPGPRGGATGTGLCRNGATLGRRPPLTRQLGCELSPLLDAGFLQIPRGVDRWCQAKD